MAATNAPMNEELREHRANYEGFCSLLKWSTAAVIVTLVLMAIFLV